ncbi:MAG: hypothetical protein WCQ99_12155 [Pseudomonadota bacterium]
MFAREIRAIIWSYILLSLGGLMLHLRIHPLEKGLLNWVPLIFGLINIFLLPFLFNRAQTASLAFMLCCLTVITGAGGMTYYSLVTWQEPVTLYTLTFKSTLCDSIILAAKLPLGFALLRHFRPEGDAGSS